MCQRCKDEDERQEELNRRIDEGLNQLKWERLKADWDKRSVFFSGAESKVFD